MNKPTSHEEAVDDRTTFGFWVYLMTDLLMFTVLFAVYAVLHDNTAGGPSGKELFNLPLVLTETVLLLTSSFTCGLGLVWPNICTGPSFFKHGANRVLSVNP
jgi:cytochrome o ubiquinol oxidase subunit 3